jgi:hypothetical protein
VCSAILLGSCAPPTIEETDAAGSALRFEHKDFSPELSEFAVRKDGRTGNVDHLAAFHGPDSEAMVVATLTTAAFVVEERSIESAVSGLLREEATIDWGARGRARWQEGHAPYRLFEIEGQPVSCVGFAHPFGEPGR